MDIRWSVSHAVVSAVTRTVTMAMPLGGVEELVFAGRSTAASVRRLFRLNHNSGTVGRAVVGLGERAGLGRRHNPIDAVRRRVKFDPLFQLLPRSVPELFNTFLAGADSCV